MLANLHTFLFLLATVYSFCYAQKTNDSLYTHTEKLTELNKTEEALNTTLQQIELAQNNSPGKAKWLELAGVIFKKNEEYDISLKYLKKAYHINQKNQDSLALMLNHLYIGQIFQFKFNALYEDRFSKKATQLKDSATFYYLKNINEFKKVSNSLNHIGSAHINLSYIYSDLNKLKLAKEHINKAINIYKNDDQLNKNAFNTSLLNLGLIYIYEEDYKLAEETNLNLLKRIKDTSELKSLIIYHQSTANLAYIYKKTKQYEKSFEYYNKEKKLQEIISERKKAIEIRTIEAKYNVEKATQIEQLKTLKAIQEKEKLEKRITYLVFAFITILLFGILIYRNSLLKQRNLSLKVANQELENQKKINALEKQLQGKIINATLDGREKERKHIAQTLHDSVSALLSSANMHLQVIKRKTSENISEIEKSQQIINEASDKIRDLSHQLVSVILMKFGLEEAVKDLEHKYSNDQLQLTVSTKNITSYPNDFKIKVFHIIQELTNNIIKHSKATKAFIELTEKNEVLIVKVKDNGIGFNVSEINKKACVGLSQIKARVENLDGTFSIQSTLNQGTKVSIQIPTNN